MRRAAYFDVLKVWLYAVLVVAAGAWVSPFFYNAGKALADVTSDKRTNGILKTMGGICRNADFPAFFVTSLVLVALLLFLPLVEWLSLKRAGRGDEVGQPLVKNRRGLLQWLTGLLLAIGLFGLIGYGLLMTGSFVWRGFTESPVTLLLRILPWILLGTLVQEWLFRAVILGIFLRALRPAVAMASMAILFTAAHFLNPPAGLNVPDPDAAGVGLQMLGLLAKRLADPLVMVKEILPLLAIGWVLGYARWRTASLWLSLGLHAGWLLVNALFIGVTRAVPREDFLARLLAGNSLAEGLIPLAGVVAAGTLVYFLTDSPNDDAISDT